MKKEITFEDNDDAIDKLNKLINMIGISNIYNCKYRHINGKMLREDHTIINKFYQYIPELKKSKLYSSNKLTALHSNCLQKQKYPAVNMLRQILKANGFHLKSVVKSDGYCWNKKLVVRDYIIEIYNVKKQIIKPNEIILTSHEVDGTISW